MVMRGRSSSVSVCCFFLAAIVILKEDSLVCGTLTIDVTKVATWSPVLHKLHSEMARERQAIFTFENGRKVEFTPPFVTLTYAQSIDGSIASADKRPVLISGKDSMQMTHALRAAHDTILVGVNTVNNDDPSLTVRLCNGTNPQPVILDSHCSIKASSKLVTSPNCVRPLIAIASSKTRISEDSRETISPKELERQGCKFLSCGHDAKGRIDLTSLLYNLSLLKYSRDGASVMVEGGASVINSFLLSGLVNFCVITIAPRFLRGLPALGPLQSSDSADGGPAAHVTPETHDPHFAPAGRDVVMYCTLRTAEA